MKRKILVLALAVIMLAIPIIGTAMAIGPENAIGKNPHLSPPMPYGFTMMLDAQNKPHGVVASWEMGSIYRLELDILLWLEVSFHCPYRCPGVFHGIGNQYIVAFAVDPFFQEGEIGNDLFL